MKCIWSKLSRAKKMRVWELVGDAIQTWCCIWPCNNGLFIRIPVNRPIWSSLCTMNDNAPMTPFLAHSTLLCLYSLHMHFGAFFLHWMSISYLVFMLHGIFALYHNLTVSCPHSVIHSSSAWLIITIICGVCVTGECHAIHLLICSPQLQYAHFFLNKMWIQHAFKC